MRLIAAPLKRRIAASMAGRVAWWTAREAVSDVTTLWPIKTGSLQIGRTDGGRIAQGRNGGAWKSSSMQYGSSHAAHVPTRSALRCSVSITLRYFGPAREEETAFLPAA